MIETELHKLYEELSSGVALVAVSKFHPFAAIVEAYEAGQRVFAESRPQELLAKQKELEALRAAAAATGSSEVPLEGLRWHFIGHLQTNKLKMVLPYVALVESVDSVRLLEAIENWGALNERITDVLLEYKVSASDEAKQGLTREEILDILCGGHPFSHVRFRGLMGMATHTEDETVIRGDFRKITALAEEVKGLDRITVGHIELHHPELSFGMSGDYKIAVEMGATMVRIGTMIFGPRVY